MSRPIIEVRNISKRYRLGQIGMTSLRDDLQRVGQWCGSKFRRSPPSNPVAAPTNHRPPASDFWALRDVSFDVQPGEVVGIIGRNGAGKSTLLKILSRITEPTSGEIRLRGRVASLLEVGTGFHPELSGRENIFLNGAILGMKRAEISRKFDEIVAFAEVEQFIDTPVKRYSSGMYVRLAFAIAAHLEPEILIVDEVLAVGDQVFQKKCLGKMDEVSRQNGRTVLFVSHNMGAIANLTKKCLLLTHGRTTLFDQTPAAITRYFADTFPKTPVWRASTANQHPMQVMLVRLLNVAGCDANEFELCDGFEVEIEHVVRGSVRDALIELWLFSSDGSRLMTFGDYDTQPELRSIRAPGSFRSRFKVPGNLLNTGSYYVVLNSGINHCTAFDHQAVASFEIVEHHGLSIRSSRGASSGYFSPVIHWRIKSLS